MKVRSINKIAYKSLIKELEQTIFTLVNKKNTKKELEELAENLNNLKYCIINTSFDSEI